MTTVKSDEKTRNKLDAIVTLIAHQESDVADLLSNGVCTCNSAKTPVVFSKDAIITTLLLRHSRGDAIHCSHR